MKTNVQILVLVISFLVSPGIFAQQDFPVSQAYLLPMYFNPAAAGMSGQTELSFLHRNQFLRLPGASRNNSFLMGTPIWYQKMGVGINCSLWEMGYLDLLTISAMLNYRIRVLGGTLSFGAQPGLRQYVLGIGQLKAEDLNDPTLGSKTILIPDLKGGLYFQQKRMKIGYSAGNLFGNKVSSESGSVLTKFRYHHYVFFSATLFAKKDWQLVSASLYKYVRKEIVQFETALYFNYKSLGKIGLSYRSESWLVPMVQLNLTGWENNSRCDLVLTYVYDIALKEYGLGNAQEISLMARFKIRPGLAAVKKRATNIHPIFN